MGMVDRVARAICRSQFAQSGQFGRKGIDKQTDKYWQDWELEARLALAELLTPTPEMIAAGRACYNGMRTPSCEEVFAAMMGAVK